MPRGLAPFDNAKTYKDVVAANVLFLEGKLSRSPYHYGPIDEETVPIVNDLIRLNQCGFITVQSQPATSEVGFITKKWYVHGQQMGNWWHATEQRPFVEGYLPIVELSRFLVFMKSQSGYYYNIYTMLDRSNKGIFAKLCPQHMIECHLAYSNMAQARYYNLTREKSSSTELGLNYAQWEHCTNLWSKIGIDYDFEEYPNIAPIIMRNSVKIIVMGKEYNQGSAVNVMLRFYENN
jgi:hypothetical protein